MTDSDAMRVIREAMHEYWRECGLPPEKRIAWKVFAMAELSASVQELADNIRMICDHD